MEKFCFHLLLLSVSLRGSFADEVKIESNLPLAPGSSASKVPPIGEKIVSRGTTTGTKPTKSAAQHTTTHSTEAHKRQILQTTTGPVNINQQNEKNNSAIPIAHAIEDLKGKGFNIETVPNDNSSLYITFPAPTTTTTPPPRLPEVDPPTIITPPRSARQQSFVTSPPPQDNSADLGPHCPSLSEFINGSQKVWNGITQADGIKAGLGVFFNAAADAISTLTHCAGKLLGDLGSFLFNTAFGGGSSSNNRKRSVNQTELNETSPNIKTSDGRANLGKKEPSGPNDSVIVIEGKTRTDKKGPLEDASSRPKRKHVHHRASAPGNLLGTAGDLDEEELEHEEEILQVDNIDPTMYQ